MSAMKPDAWMDSSGVCYTNKVSADYYGCSEPLYTLATVRKWLEEVTDEMFNAADSSGCLIHGDEDCNRHDTEAKILWETMLAAKLLEMEGRDV